MSTGHQSPQSTLPPFALKTLNTTTWGSTANSVTITDEYIHPNSFVLAQVSSSSVQAAGRWSYVVSQGQVIIYSSDAESSTLPITYIVI